MRLVLPNLCLPSFGRARQCDQPTSTEVCMRAKLMTIGITAAAMIALALQASPQAIAQGNANKPAAAKKAKAAATKNENAAAPAQAAKPAEKPAACAGAAAF